MYTYITSLAPRGQIYPFRLSFSLFFFFFFVPVSCSLHDVIFIFPPFSPSRLFGRTCSYHLIYIIRFDIIFFSSSSERHFSVWRFFVFTFSWDWIFNVASFEFPEILSSWVRFDVGSFFFLWKKKLFFSWMEIFVIIFFGIIRFSIFWQIRKIFFTIQKNWRSRWKFLVKQAVNFFLL